MLEQIKEFLRQLFTEETLNQILIALGKVKELAQVFIEWIIKFRDWLYEVAMRFFG